MTIDPSTSEPRRTDATDELADMRVDYAGPGFDVADLAGSWWAQFERWLAAAIDAGVTEPNAIVLATASADGEPAARNVLAKQVDEGGLVFYTNYASAKSADLTANPRASATFSWLSLHRQVHLRGRVEKVDAATTEAYWRSRPRGSQLGAWVSTVRPQSSVLTGRADLAAALAEVAERFGAGGSEGDAAAIPVPPQWGGWRLVPRTVEFWQGQRSRIHDRLRFRLTDTGRWVVERLAP